MRLRQARQSAGLTQPQAVERLKDAPAGFDVPTLSRCENGVVVPTPVTLRELAAIYGTEASGLYDPEELDYGLGRPKKPAVPPGGKDVYKLTVRLDAGLASRLFAALDALGVDGPTAWVTRYARYTVRRARLAAGKTRTDVDGVRTPVSRGVTGGTNVHQPMPAGTRAGNGGSALTPRRVVRSAGEKKSAVGAATPAGAKDNSSPSV